MTPEQRIAAGRKGGLVRSAAKNRALKSLHASRRGVRQHTGSERDRATVLGDLAAVLREPVRGVRSIRVLADHLRVSDRTVRRWLTGEDWPPPTQLRRIKSWLGGHL